MIRRLRQWPLRIKLTLWTAAVVGVALFVFGISLTVHLYRERVEILDHALDDEAKDFFRALRARDWRVDWGDPRAVDTLFAKAGRLRFVEVAGPGGEALYRSGNLGSYRFEGHERRPGFRNVRLNEMTMRECVRSENGLSLLLAVDTDDLIEIATDLFFVYLLALPLILATVGAGGWWVAHRALAPVAAIAAAAEQITARRLDQRLPVPPTRDEINRLSVVLNRMIDRLEASFQQATRFSADASHELKTPLTVMRGELEAALQSEGEGRAPADERLLLNLLEETGRLSAITESLLLLSRADAGRLELDFAVLDLSALLAEAVEDAEILAAPRGIRIHADLPPSAPIRADAARLRQVLLNLLDNAIKYNHPGGRVTVTLTTGGGWHEVLFANTGPSIPPEHAGRIFERFHRVNGSTPHDAAAATSHGLGLSLCREIVRVHEGEIALEASGPDCTKLRLRLRPAGKSDLRPELPGSELASLE